MANNRFTVLVDACALAPVLHRNLLLSLAEAGLFRLRWSTRILDETEKAVATILKRQSLGEPSQRAKEAREKMELAFPEALVDRYEVLEASVPELPDPNDRHVIAAALKTRAAAIVTDNLKDFPQALLSDLELEILNTDTFIAGSIDLKPAKAVEAVKTMRERLRRPQMTAEDLLRKMEERGLVATAGQLADKTALF